MNKQKKLYRYLETVLSAARNSAQNIFMVTAFTECNTQERVTVRNINNDRVYPVDNQLLEEFANETQLQVERAMIHTGPYADELSRSLHTLALTVGTDIYFRNKAYKPETEEGRKTLAHELTHIHQHTRDILKGETTRAELEAEAEAAEEKFAYTAEKIKTLKIGNDIYQLREHEYKRLTHDLKNLVEEEVERKIRSEEEAGLSMLIAYTDMLKNRKLPWQQ